ncbi:hypothetical protein GJ744_011812 [Endocarpon pusillum]|uniref:Uncharacterized protein n=1 Tax=Endocarpon pusillum TaxID=364733 RepID=A0A8H7AFW9_9EURO|nr:hypothetical protein GJ744_011812 [Endocarpon pusillum]
MYRYGVVFTDCQIAILVIAQPAPLIAQPAPPIPHISPLIGFEYVRQLKASTDAISEMANDHSAMSPSHSRLGLYKLMCFLMRPNSQSIYDGKPHKLQAS